MNKTKNKIGLAIATVYLLMVFAALFFAVINLTKSAFTGIYLVTLTIPWSFAFTAILDQLKIQDSVPIFMKYFVLLLFAAINVSLIYRLTRPRKSNDHLP